MKKRRRKYTEEFKKEAVKLILEQGYPISETASNLGVHPNYLGKWKREYEDGETDGSSNSCHFNASYIYR